MDHLYPDYNDEGFSIKIAKKKEFSDLKQSYSIVDPEEESERLCNMAFELRPHQQFVRNFMSINTPYNSLLLYHGLGTGKTCSAIGVCEEMREYMKQTNNTKRIIVVASPNVQENFRLQLFDDRKLTQVNGLWNIEACSGKQFLREINPTNLKNLSRDRVISQIGRIIKNNYLFLGYIEFGNYIEKILTLKDKSMSRERREKIQKRKLEKTFKNRLIVIDEVHNIRLSDDNKDKRVAMNLLKLVEEVNGTRLLLLSATPMYNNYKEIIWLLSLMQMNNGQRPIDGSEIFDKQGNFVMGPNGEQFGRAKLLESSRGLVSFIRGDNPYTFPFRVYPLDFDSTKSTRSDAYEYPKKNINGNPIIQEIEYLDLCIVPVGSYQKKIYKKIVTEMKSKQKKNKKEMPTSENMEKFGYTVLQKPLEALNMVYPQKKEEGEDYDLSTMVGKSGLNRIMTHERISGKRSNYKYKTPFLKKFGKIFTKDLIGQYSSKIKSICDNVMNSEGIVMVYSQYLDGGLLPVALALEESGFKRYNSKDSLLKSTSVTLENAPTYVMITGDKTLSSDNAGEVKAISSEDNNDGSKIKVLLISRAGSEGLDFTNLRQVHIMEPWYNTNRIEQTIGRAVRNCSHKKLPFSKRNVMIFLYGSQLENDTEAADMYVYRVAEEKAVKIGNVSRVLKESAVDCLLHAEQSRLTEENFDMTKTLVLSNGAQIKYRVGDRKFSQLCDFMDYCEYKCVPALEDEANINTYTYDENFIKDVSNLKRSIKRLFGSHYFYKKVDLLEELQKQHNTSTEQIYFALNKMMNDPNEVLVDMHGRSGKLVNVGEYYFFQPSELKHLHTTLYEKSRPIDYKRDKLVLLREQEENTTNVNMNDGRIDDLLVIIRKNIEKSKNPTKVAKGEYDWFMHCANALVRLSGMDFSEELLHELVLEHIIDLLVLDEKLLLLNHIYYSGSSNDLERAIKNVFDKKILGDGIFIQSKGISTLYVKGETQWKEGEQTDKMKLGALLQKKIGEILPNLNTHIGFIAEFKKSYFVFKTKNLKLKRHKGARCDQASKSETIKMLKNYHKLDEDTLHQMNKVEMCAFMELLLRSFNSNKKDGKVWFVEPEYSQLLKLEEYIQK